MTRKTAPAPETPIPSATGLDRSLRQLVGYTMKRATNCMMADAALEAHEDAMLADLSAEERATLVALLRRIDQIDQ